MAVHLEHGRDGNLYVLTSSRPQVALPNASLTSLAIIVAFLGSFRQPYFMTNDRNKLLKPGKIRSSVSVWPNFSFFRSRTSSEWSVFTQRLVSFLRPKSKSSNSDTSYDEWSGSTRSSNKNSTGVGEPIAPMTTVYNSHSMDASSGSQRQY